MKKSFKKLFVVGSIFAVGVFIQGCRKGSQEKSGPDPKAALLSFQGACSEDINKYCQKAPKLMKCMNENATKLQKKCQNAIDALSNAIDRNK